MSLLLGILLAVLSPVDSIDLEVREFMRRWHLKGMEISAVKGGETILEKAYGWADVNAGCHMTADNTMRVASVSKLITATGIMKLKEEGRLELTDKLFGDDGILCEYNKYIRDSRYRLIDIDNLLRHEGGFSQKGGDPMFSRRGGADNAELLERELSRPLSFYPGTAMEYSNLGYLLLSLVIEKLGGMPYEDWVRQNLLLPAGINDMWLTHNEAENKYPCEVHYYTDSGEDECCYSRNDIRALSGAGAWTASANDLCRFAAAIDGRDDVPDIISKESVAEMTCWYDPYTYSLGWNDTHPEKGWTRTGSYNGTSALVWHFPDGSCWTLITNTSSWKGSRFSRNTKALINRLHSISTNQNTQ